MKYNGTYLGVGLLSLVLLLATILTYLGSCLCGRGLCFVMMLDVNLVWVDFEVMMVE